MAIQVCPKCGAKNRVDERAAVVSQPVCVRCGEKLSVAEATAGVGAADGRPHVVTDETFARDVLSASSSLPVLVDAWAAWCGPCRMLAPVLDELALESGGRYKIAKLNVDQNPRTAAQFNIRSIPTLLIFKNGQLIDQIVGVQPKQTIAARLREHVAETRP
jgi:thioredoxin